MSDLKELVFPDTVKYSKEHTWARLEGDTATVGISDYAQDQLGEIVYIELPELGARFGTDEVFGFVESIKTASELYMPVAGEIVEVNPELEDAPEIVNSDPFEEGWMLKIKVKDAGEVDNLLDAQGYRDNLR